MTGTSSARRTRCVFIGVIALTALALAITSPRQAAQATDDQQATTTRDDAPTAPIKPRSGGPELGDVVAADPDWLFFDTDTDGAIWAASDAYKVRFDADGVMYVPFLGSSAPRNYPVRLRVDKVHVGDQPLPFVEDAGPTRLDKTIHFDRGAFVERYEVGPSSMEQLFEFAELPADGELTIRLAVETDLDRLETADALEFANERGTVRYSKAVVFDAAGSTAVAPTGLIDGRIEIRVSEAFLDEAVFPITIDPVIVTFTIEDHLERSRFASVAYDLSYGRYHVVWERNSSAADGDILSELYNSIGAVVPGSRVAIDLTTENWRFPQTANNNSENQFIVVASKGNVGSRVISGRMRAAFSNGMGNQFQISPTSYPLDMLHPGVGGDPNPTGPTYYLVVWEAAYDPGDHDILARRVDPYENLGAMAIHVDDTRDTLDTHPSISKCNGGPPESDQEWTIVWDREISWGNHDIRGAQIHWNGDVITTPSFIIDDSPADDRWPVVSSPLDRYGGGPRPYLVAYQRGPSSNRDIAGTVLVGSTVIDTENLTSLEGANTALDQINPALDSCGTSFTLVYSEEHSGTDYDIYAATFCLHGSDLVLGEGRQNLAFHPDGEFEPDIVAAHSGGSTSDRLMVVWTDKASGSFGDIEGGLYDVEFSCPPNDDCDHAFEVFPGQVAAGDLFHASNDGVSPCGGSGQATNPDVWYTFTAPYPGRLWVSTCGTNDSLGQDQGMDTVISMHSGCPGDSDNAVGCNDDAGPPDCGTADQGSRRDSSAMMCMSAAQTTLIRVTHYGDGLSDGRFDLNIEYTACTGDTDFDGDVDVDDLITIITQWGWTSYPGGSPGDVVCDGVVDIDDLVNGVILNWGQCP